VGFGDNRVITNKDIVYSWQEKDSAGTLASGNIRFMQDITGVLWKGHRKQQWVLQSY